MSIHLRPRLSFFVRHGFGLILALVIVGFFYGQKIERLLFPPVDGERIVSLFPHKDGGLAMRFSASRNRSCTYIESRWYVQTPSGLEHEPRVWVDGELPLNRPLGRNLSPINIFPSPGTYYLRIALKCGFPWESVVTLGPFDIR